MIKKTSSPAKSLNDKFVEVYTFSLAGFSFVATAISLCFGFRNVRGTYQFFTLNDSNAVFFFIGALLIYCSLLSVIIHALGPVGYSASEIFWRFPGRPALPKNPWHVPFSWVAILGWSLPAVLLATVFAPLSATWLAGTAIGAILYGVLLVVGMSGAQLVGKQKLLLGWATLCSLLGTFITFASTAHATSSLQEVLTIVAATTLLGIGIVLSLILSIMGYKKPLTLSAATTAFGRRTVLLSALLNVSSPQSYTYFGSSQRFFRRRLLRATPVILSIAGVLDSWNVLIGVSVFLLPLAVFLSIAWGSIGTITTVIIGCWIIATLFRWLSREWTAQRSLRSWLGGSSFHQLLGFSVGPALACALVTSVYALSFALPLYSAVIALLMGFTVSLGDATPQQTSNYDLLVTTQDGVMIPVDLMIATIKFVVLVGLHIAAVLMGPVAGVLLALLMLGVSLFEHYRAK